ncbi:MAG: hypothetical protein K6G00_07895 [Treponema sp.]|nr:hypothetical protein [Treponema sp.]
MDKIKAKIIWLHIVKIKMLTAIFVLIYKRIPKYPHKTCAESTSPKALTHIGTGTVKIIIIKQKEKIETNRVIMISMSLNGSK